MNNHLIRDTGRIGWLTVLCLAVGSLLGGQRSDAAESSSRGRTRDYHFEGTIAREVLENYLDRSVTMAYFLVTGKAEGNREYLYRDDDVRLIQDLGAKFIGRAIYRWNGESRLNEPGFWADAKALIEKVHAFDPDVADTKSIFVWGWDEISRFSLQPKEYRNKFLVYAHHWLKETDPNGHLQMPVSRMITCPNETQGNYRANTKSSACPIGYSQEETIKKIWSDNSRQAGG